MVQRGVVVVCVMANSRTTDVVARCGVAAGRSHGSTIFLVFERPSNSHQRGVNRNELTRRHCHGNRVWPAG